MRIEGTTTAPPRHIAAQTEALTYTLREPVGVAGQIVPWNVPLSTAILKLAPALAAGCTVVMKPSEETPLSALALGGMILEAGIPAGVVNIVNGVGAEAGQALAEHPGVDKISFTGSTATGQTILRQSAHDLKRVSLELGGKSATIVYPDADLARAVPGVAMGIFGNSGQVCAAGSRLFLHDSIHDEFLSRLAGFAAGLKVGPGTQAGVAMGPLISAGQRARVMGYIESGLAEGATLLTGGDTPDSPGFFVNPTVFVDARPDMRIVREEIFGPVLTVQRFGDDSPEVLAARANDSVYGLSAYVWTSNLGNAHALARRLRSGSVKVNGSGMEFALPFGGFRQSGIGRENGRMGVEAFTETKSVMIGW